MSRSPALVVSVMLCLAASGPLSAQTPRALYTWAGTGNTQMWFKNFGTPALDPILENTTDGELTVTEQSGDGATYAISDDFNKVVEGRAGQGGLDLTGLVAMEIDMGHDGTDPVLVQVFVQAGVASTYVALLDVPVTPGVNTYTADLAALSPDQIAYIRTVGLNIADHVDQGDLVWTIREVRSAGSPLESRDLATHEPGTPDNGLHGALVNFDASAVQGNDGGQNQSGLSQNIGEPPPGNTGSLAWTDLASGNGAAITWGNGTALCPPGQGCNTFWNRPADLSSYGKIVIRMAAANTDGLVESLGVQYFLQNYEFGRFSDAGVQQLPADGEYHDLVFDIVGIPYLDFVDQHGVNLQGHAGGDLTINIDHVRAEAPESITDCNRNSKDDAQDLAEGTSQDCNESLIPDECDIASTASEDCNTNDIPDECEIRAAVSSRVLYTWQGTGDPRGWTKSFGDNEILLDNATDGELTVSEIGQDGTFVAFADAFNEIAEGAPTAGGLDLSGMTSLEIDLAHSGAGPINVQFYVQATPVFTYVALGPDVAIPPEAATYTLPLDDLTASQLTYIRAIGVNVREHLDQGNVVWTVSELRVAGAPLSRRDYATHDPGSSDNGLQGAVVAFDLGAVAGNDGNVNQTGLSQNVSASPPGNSGTLRWTDVAGQNGGAVTWFNGTVFCRPDDPAQCDTFNERPTDMSPFTEIVVRIAATNVTPGAVELVSVEYFLETGGFNFSAAGDPQELLADGQFHELTFPIAGLPDLRYVDAHGVNLGEHVEGDLVIDVDNLRAISRAPTPRDCDANLIPDDCDIAAGRLTDADLDGIPDECVPVGEFRRADSNSDLRVDISDAIFNLSHLFVGGPPPLCRDAADMNDDGRVDISDAVYLLTRLFLGGDPIPAPADSCGLDPTDDVIEECNYPPELCG